MNIKLRTDLPEYLREAEEIVRAFSPYIVVDDLALNEISLYATAEDGNFYGEITSTFKDKETVSYQNTDDFNLFKKLSKRLYKNTLYKYLSSYLGISLPYGSLTGVRPTKLMHEAIKNGLDKEYLIKEFFVSDDKASLISTVVENQQGIYDLSENNADIYVHIPFCPTRCNYCSFISSEYKRIEKRIEEYRDAVVREICLLKKISKEKQYKIRSVYVGGGTPSVLPTEILDDILKEIKGIAPEFTVECGRPDTITKELAEVLNKNGVTRTSVNPQTFFDETLQKIGRKHTIADFYNAYDILKSHNLSINIDLIAGLTDETVDNFKTSINKAILLDSDSITIHSLSLKRGSRISEEGKTKNFFGDVSEMLSFAHHRLRDAGYFPYYMYRQKNSADNLENTGYSKKGKQCIYNIDVMEDTTTILSAGAGSMSKLVSNNGRKIERLSTPKGFEEYLLRIDEIINKKRDFFCGNKEK